jgi:hypothetical protein
MDLLPLEDGSWTSPASGTVYFPQFEGIDIPPDVNLRLISRNVTNESRKELFEALGVQTASAPLVRRQILHRYSGEALSLLFTIPISRHHLQVLYVTEHLRDSDEPSYSSLAIIDTNGNIRKPSEFYIFIKNDDLNGPWELLRSTEPGPNPGDGAPGRFAPFVHDEYFVDVPSRTQHQSLPWTEWLHRKLQVERILPIIVKDRKLIWDGSYIQKHRPEKFFRCLRLYLADSKHQTQGLIDCLRETDVLCRGHRQLPLKQTYFPIKELESRSDKFLGDDIFFPWLYLDEELAFDGIPPSWRSSLTALGLGRPSDLDFALDMLSYFVDAFSRETFSRDVNSTSRVRLFELYEHVHVKFREAQDRVEAHGKMQYVTVALLILAF